MAARLNPQQSERAKEAIQTTQLCKRLNGFALSLPDDQTGKPIEMTPAQVKAAVALLKKTLPDLQSIEGGLDINMNHEKALKDLE